MADPIESLINIKVKMQDAVSQMNDGLTILTKFGDQGENVNKVMDELGTTFVKRAQRNAKTIQTLADSISEAISKSGGFAPIPTNISPTPMLPGSAPLPSGMAPLPPIRDPIDIGIPEFAQRDFIARQIEVALANLDEAMKPLENAINKSIKRSSMAFSEFFKDNWQEIIRDMTSEVTGVTVGGPREIGLVDSFKQGFSESKKDTNIFVSDMKQSFKDIALFIPRVIVTTVNKGLKLLPKSVRNWFDKAAKQAADGAGRIAGVINAGIISPVTGAAKGFMSFAGKARKGLGFVGAIGSKVFWVFGILFSIISGGIGIITSFFSALFGFITGTIKMVGKMIKSFVNFISKGSELEKTAVEIGLAMGQTRGEADDFAVSLVKIINSTGTTIKEAIGLSNALSKVGINFGDLSKDSTEIDKSLVRLVDTFKLAPEAAAGAFTGMRRLGGSFNDLLDDVAGLQTTFQARGVFAKLPDIVSAADDMIVDFGKTFAGSGKTIAKSASKSGIAINKGLGIATDKAIDLALGAIKKFQGSLRTSRDVMLGLSDDFDPLQNALFETGASFSEIQELIRRGAESPLEFVRGFNELIEKMKLQGRDPLAIERVIRNVSMRSDDLTKRLIQNRDQWDKVQEIFRKKQESDKAAKSFDELSKGMRDTAVTSVQVLRNIFNLTKEIGKLFIAKEVGKIFGDFSNVGERLNKFLLGFSDAIKKGEITLLSFGITASGSIKTMFTKIFSILDNDKATFAEKFSGITTIISDSFVSAAGTVFGTMRSMMDKVAKAILFGLPMINDNASKLGNGIGRSIGKAVDAFFKPGKKGEMSILSSLTIMFGSLMSTLGNFLRSSLNGLLKEMFEIAEDKAEAFAGKSAVKLSIAMNKALLKRAETSKTANFLLARMGITTETLSRDISDAERELIRINDTAKRVEMLEAQREKAMSVAGKLQKIVDISDENKRREFFDQMVRERGKAPIDLGVTSEMLRRGQAAPALAPATDAEIRRNFMQELVGMRKGLAARAVSVSSGADPALRNRLERLMTAGAPNDLNTLVKEINELKALLAKGDLTKIRETLEAANKQRSEGNKDRKNQVKSTNRLYDPFGGGRNVRKMNTGN